jgi:hypothetical protein
MSTAGPGVTTSAPPGSPIGKCHAVATALCTKQATCTGGTRATAGCIQDAIDKIRCNQVTSVGAGYDRCLADIAAGTCPPTLPASCQGVFSTAAPPAGGGGGGGSWTCDVHASYRVCYGPPEDFPLCSTKDINLFGIGPSEADAQLVALKLCNEELAKQIVINNVYWHTSTESDCDIVSCRRN